MRILGTPLDQVDLAMVERLCDDKTAESLTHDYKVQLPKRGDDEQKGKLLEHLTSFANAAGGVLIFGFDGKNWRLPGLSGFDDDGDVRRLEELARFAEPPLPRLAPKVISRPDASPLLLIGVRGSMARPHRVPLKYGGGFFARTNRGKQPMELSELRRSFLEADAWEREAEAFRAERVTRGIEGETAAGFHNPDGFFVHVIPLGRLRALHDLSPVTSSITRFADSWNVGGERTSRPNIDGWAATVIGPAGRIWMQVFRSGAVEVCFRRALVEVGGVGPTRILGFELDEYVSKIGAQALEWLVGLEVESPYVAFISAVGLAAGMPLVNHTKVGAQIGRFDREMILSPGIVLEEPLPTPADALKPALDLIWQAGGWPAGTPNVNGAGQLTVRHR